MKKNMSSADRVIRILVAVAIVTLYAIHVISGTVGLVLLVLAGVFVLTSFISFCPLYSIFAFNTLSKEKSKIQ